MNYFIILFSYLYEQVMCWFAAKTTYRGEFKAQDFFKSMRINSYVPYYKSKRVWSDRIKNITVPAISGYVFFELSKINYQLININPFTKNIVKGINGLPAVINEKEISTLKKHLNGDCLACSSDLFKGQKIKVNSGPFIFKKGTIDKVSCNKVVISIEAMNISLVLNKSSVIAA